MLAWVEGGAGPRVLDIRVEADRLDVVVVTGAVDSPGVTGAE